VDDAGAAADPGPEAGGPAARPGRGAWPLASLLVAVAAFPASIGAFWWARDSGAARPLCGDRPGVHAPVCQLPAPWGTGSPPTTRGFQP